MRLLDRIAVVTGAGRGIGKAISLRFAREGAKVVLAGTNEARLQSTANQITDLGRRSLVVVADISQEDQVNSLAKRAREELGPLDILVNNAAIIGPTALIGDVTLPDWDRVLAVNLTGVFLCSRAMAADMIQQGHGKIINISSIAGKRGYALRAPYCVSKWGLHGLTLTLAKELGEHGIQVNAICPGPVEGERMTRVIEDRAQKLGKSAKEIEREYLQDTLFGRMVGEDDVAALVNFLASPEADNITGQIIDVAAGYAL